jgi:flagella basal body P-ring formation protein FlgA
MVKPFCPFIMMAFTGLIFSSIVLAGDIQQEKITNQGDFMIIDRETIEKRLFEEILKRIRWPKDLVKFEVLSGPRDVILPKGDVNWEIKIPKWGLDQGNCSIRVVFYVDGKIRDSIWVSFKIYLYRPVLVASRPIEKNASLSPEDLRLDPIPFERSQKIYLTDPNQVHGKVAKKAIVPGEPITMEIIESPILVKSGNLVTMVAERGPLMITTIGQACEKGSYGDFIKLINISSRKVVYGIVVGFKRVKVEF